MVLIGYWIHTEGEEVKLTQFLEIQWCLKMLPTMDICIPFYCTYIHIGG